MAINYYFLRGISFVQRAINSFKLLCCGKRGKVYVFHEVDSINRFNVEPSSFCSIELFKQVLSDPNLNFGTIENLLESDNKDITVVTFDDVPESVYLNAYPFLCENNIPFVLYISPKYINKNGFLSEKQIIEMSKNPLCTIGSHTMSHGKLRLLENSYEDMKQSKLFIEKLINKEVIHLAYPYGRADSISSKVIKEAKDIGYKSAMCTIPTLVPRKVNNWYIPRIAVF